MHAIFRMHHELASEWAVMLETLEFDGLAPYVAKNARILVTRYIDALAADQVGLQASPYVHEIIAMMIFGDRAEVLQVYRNVHDTFYDLATGDRRYGESPTAASPSGQVSYTYAQWERIDGRWTEISAVFSTESALTPVEWLAVESPPLVPYIALWEAALAQEAVARGGR